MEAVNEVAGILGINPKELLEEYKKRYKEGREADSGKKYNGTGLPY